MRCTQNISIVFLTRLCVMNHTWCIHRGIHLVVVQRDMCVLCMNTYSIIKRRRWLRNIIKYRNLFIIIACQ